MVLEDYTRPDYTRCRTYGHSWDEADSTWRQPNMGGTPMTFNCGRCTTERRELWSSTGRLLWRKYIYADGYQQHWGDNFPTKDDFRVALMAIANRERRAVKRNGGAKKAAS